MAGYTPVFDSVFQGSLCGKYPDLPVWLVLLALQQRGGVVDAHPSYIAMVSGLPQTDIEVAIARFCEPDPSSRTPDEDGRRLIPLQGRGFGWRIVNHEAYRDKARKATYDEKRTASGADAERKKKSRRVPTPPDESRVVPPSEAEAEAEAEKRERTRKTRASRVPPEFEPDREYALSVLPDLDVETEIRKFRDWEFKTPRSDWPAVWRLWIQRCKEKGDYARRGGAKGDPYAGAI